jgi:hypothetical protein
MPGMNGIVKPVAMAEAGGLTDLGDASGTMPSSSSPATSVPVAGATGPSGIAGTVGN